MRNLFIVVFLGLALLCTPALAWNERGHRVAASIAYRQLSPSQRAAIIALLEKHPRFHEDFESLMPAGVRNADETTRQEWLFQQAAVWPDLVKDGRPVHADFNRPLWHFVNRPYFLTADDRDALQDAIDVNLATNPPTGDFDSPQMNVIQAIANSSRIVAAPDQLDAVKAIHVCWLLHAIGDVHQPLHSAALFSRRLLPHGDRGGNSIRTNPGKSLYGVWDEGIGTEKSFESCRDAAVALLTSADHRALAVQATQQQDTLIWWNESYELAVGVVYGGDVASSIRTLELGHDALGSHPIPLSDAYLQNRTEQSERAVIKAGARCAGRLAALTSGQPILIGSNRQVLLGGGPVPGESPFVRGGQMIKSHGPEGSRLSPIVPDAMSIDRVRGERGATAATSFASYDPAFPPPAGTATFELSQAYPKSYDVDEKFPWMEIDFRTHSVSYLNSLLKYCLEGNLDVDFRGQDNPVRKWYHAPWMHDDGADKQQGRRQGREYHHGLTRERHSRKLELHPLQTSERVQNWAVSLYSPRGGYTLGNVWKTVDGTPDPTRATFPDNTVSIKLLFTAAPVAEVPFLAGGFRWTANINPISALPAGTSFNRVDHDVVLLQVDVAVKDPRVADGTGWVFGTFIYDGSRPGSQPFDKLVPVGLSWGDDSQEQRMINLTGSFLNPFLRESVINTELLEPPASVDWGGRAFVRHHGLGGRLNGPVDNPSSSCISCHGRAGTALVTSADDPLAGYPMPILNKRGELNEQIEAFSDLFREIRPNSQLQRAPVEGQGTQTFTTVDYSLQLSQGIRNYYQALKFPPTPPMPVAPAAAFEAGDRARRVRRVVLPQVSRDEHDGR